MKNRLMVSLVFAWTCCAAWSNSVADESKTETVTQGNFSVYQKTSAVVESQKLTPMKTDLKVWKTLVIDSIVPEGSRVKPGDLVLQFETDKFQKAVYDAKLALQTAKLDSQDSKIAREQIEKTFEMDVEQTKRTLAQAKEDYEHYLKVEVPQRERMMEYSLKSSEWGLENDLEEYNQLLKMYEEDELTEESEKIVLKRAKRSVDTSRMFLENAKSRYERTKNFLNPRANQLKKEEMKRKEISHEKSMIDLNAKKERAFIAFQKSEVALQKQEKGLADLQNDGTQLAFKAPLAGVLYYGKCTNGKWTSGSGTPNRSLEKGKTIAANQIVVTIVDPDNLQVRISVSESLLGKLKAGDIGQAIPKSNPASKIPLKIVKLSNIPMAEGKFECIAGLEFDNQNLQLMPGMACDVVFKTYASSNALTVSKTSVFSDDEGLTHYVYLEGEKEPSKVQVEVGETSGDRIEIKTGLKAGQKILKKKP